jgi:hypothetical protein
VTNGKCWTSFAVTAVDIDPFVTGSTQPRDLVADSIVLTVFDGEVH